MDGWLILKIWRESSFRPNLNLLILQTLFYTFIPYKKISKFRTKPYKLSERLDLRNEKLTTNLWVKFSKYFTFLCSILLFVFLTDSVAFPISLNFTSYLWNTLYCHPGVGYVPAQLKRGCSLILAVMNCLSKFMQTGK